MALRAVRLISPVSMQFAPAKTIRGTLVDRPLRRAMLNVAAKAHFFGIEQGTARSTSHQKLTAPHDWFIVEPDVEIAADAVDMRFRGPIGPGVFGVGMAKSDVNGGNFFVLQNVADHVCAGRVRADRKFTYAIAVFIGTRVSAKFFKQRLVGAAKIDNPVVAHFDCQRRVLEIAVLAAQVIANHSIDDEDSIGVFR